MGASRRAAEGEENGTAGVAKMVVVFQNDVCCEIQAAAAAVRVIHSMTSTIMVNRSIDFMGVGNAFIIAEEF